MKPEDVPQDSSATYSGHKKLLYAQSDGEGYAPVQSSGWKIEEAATQDAVGHYLQLAADAAEQVKAGQKSPLFYYMYKQRMDLALLAQTTGHFQWQIKRHFKPAVFARLSSKQIQRYADAMDLSPDQLKKTPETL